MKWRFIKSVKFYAERVVLHVSLCVFYTTDAASESPSSGDDDDDDNKEYAARPLSLYLYSYWTCKSCLECR